MRADLLRLALIAACACLLSACNTIRGVGEDLSAMGGTLSRVAGD